jgi:predicted secreted Zn-dependent protease
MLQGIAAEGKTTMQLLQRLAAPRALFGAAMAAGLSVAAMPANAGVSSSTTVADYRVNGTTATGLVAYMLNHPLPATVSDTVAHIQPNYSLAVATKELGGVCKPAGVDLHIRFDIVLPKATQASEMSPTTLAAWNSFAAFARRHEETRRGIYLKCAAEFEAEAMRQVASSCAALDANIRRLLEAEKRACDVRQNDFARVQYRLVLNERLFVLANYAGRKPAYSVPVSGPSSALGAPR